MAAIRVAHLKSTRIMPIAPTIAIAATRMSNAKQTRVCGNRMCGQAFVAGPRYKASWCGPCKNWLALYGDIRNPNRS